MNCPFCNSEEIKYRIIYKNNLAIAFLGNMPIVNGHMLICSIRHVAKIDQLTSKELKAIIDCIIQVKKILKKSLRAQGFNIAWNEGEMAGQTVNHLHIHVLPRMVGDQGIYEYDPRKFLYRTGKRRISSMRELKEVVKLIKKSSLI